MEEVVSSILISSTACPQSSPTTAGIGIFGCSTALYSLPFGESSGDRYSPGYALPRAHPLAKVADRGCSPGPVEAHPKAKRSGASLGHARAREDMPASGGGPDLAMVA